MKPSGPPRDRLTWLIGLYFVLWLIEGPIRKWLPTLNPVLYAARDPVAVVAYWYAFRQRVLGFDLMMGSWLALTVVLIGICITNGETHWIISAYGVRTYVLHVPFMFVIGRHLALRDLRRMGRMLIWLTLPMAILVGVQFLSSPSAWINVAAGGDLASQQGGVEDRIRPPGIFTYGAGLASYLGLVLCFLAVEVRVSRGRNLLFCTGAAALVAVMYALSISRGAVLSAGITLVAIFFFGFTGRNAMVVRLASFAILVIVALALAKVGLVQQGIEAFKERWTAADVDVDKSAFGLILSRVGSSFLGFVNYTDGVPPWGFGPGMGTNVGSYIMTGGPSFLLAEDEWSRIIMECGLIVGSLVLVFRSLLAGTVFRHALRAYRAGDGIGMVFCISGILGILNGQWGPPTNLGVIILCGGFALAASRADSVIQLRQLEDPGPGGPAVFRLPRPRTGSTSPG